MKKSIIFSVFLFSFISFQILGQTWSGPTRFTWNSGGSIRPSIATDSGNRIFVVWSDSTPGNKEIFYKRSTDSGINWTGLTRLTWNAGDSFTPSIAADSGNRIYVAWSDFTPGNKEIFFKHSSDNGATWSGPKRLTWNLGQSLAPSIIADSGSGLHLVWYDTTTGGTEIFYKRSTDGGINWSGLTRLTWNSGNAVTPSIAADSGSGIHVVWSDAIPGGTEILYKRSTDGGVTWSGIKRLTRKAGGCFTPSIAADSGSGIHVVCRNYVPEWRWEIFYKRSTDGGASWSVLKRMTWKVTHSGEPSITTDSGSGIHVAWDEHSLFDGEIFYKRSSDGGATWYGLKRLTWNAGDSDYPSIAADSGSGIHVAWNDDTPGNWEIFYKNRK